MMTERGRPQGGGQADVRPRHIPVLLTEVLRALEPVADGSIVDATFGAGGYSQAILAAGAARVLGIDRDPSTIAAGAAIAAEAHGRLVLEHGRFSDLEAIARRHGLEQVDGVVFDLGVSSMQLDESDRGFSFQAEGPLDMRMSAAGMSAADVVNTRSEQEIADILFQLGEERRSRAIARAIVQARQISPIKTTKELAGIVVRVLGRPSRGERHPATRSFQALRIFVNDELGELVRGLAAAERILKPGGRLVVVSFHSLEDRIVKRFLTLRAGKAAQTSRHLPGAPEARLAPSFRIVNRHPLTASESEVAANPRARSSRLRAAERTAAEVWPAGTSAELDVPPLADLSRSGQ